MMRLLIGLTFFFCLHAMADVPATGYFLVDTKELYAFLASSRKDVSRLTMAEVEKMAVVSGHFEGDCNLHLRSRYYQYHIKARRVDDGTIYAFSVYDAKTSSQLFSENRTMKIAQYFLTLSPRSSKYTLLLIHLNLKK